MSDTVTRGVRIQVEPEFVPEQSSPEQGQWFFAYHVEISNQGAEVVQLLSRHWIITNAHGVQEHVKGPGVVGKQPVLQPGESFRYTSACPLETSMGTMHGSFQIVTQGGARFDARIEPFTLAEPLSLN
jgi:ApaG protein